ncbi:MAG: hypothetical protein R3Y39_08520 [Rikenellaceae bacterium]
MRITQGTEGVALTECINPQKNKWMIRADVQPNINEDGEQQGVRYYEEELSHEPTDEDWAELELNVSISKANETATIDKYKSLVDSVDFSTHLELAQDIPNTSVRSWESYMGETLPAGKMVGYKGYNYVSITAIQVIDVYAPTLAVNNYQLYQGKYGYQWISGEYIDLGYTRYYNGVLYTAIQKPSDNIASPDLVPAIWEEV